jgi:nicotinamidase-related amidase
MAPQLIGEQTAVSVRPALVVIDMQRAIDDPVWAAAGPRNNPFAEANLARLLATWRNRGWPIFHVRHDSREPDSTFRPGGPGAAFKPEATPIPGETVLSKHTANAFLSTDLDAELKQRHITALVVSGVITNNSVESTVRMAAEIGYDVTVVEDAVFTFARRDRGGHIWAAEEVHAISLANLEQGGYARIAATAALCTEASSDRVAS